MACPSDGRGIPEIDALRLGKDTEYPQQYDPDLLQALPRHIARDELGIREDALPFHGRDEWNAYELSWLDSGGKPVVAIGRLSFPCTSPRLVESKSLKLYLNSYNQTRMGSSQEVAEHIRHDLGTVAGAPVVVRLIPASGWPEEKLGTLPGECIDHQEIEVDRYRLDPSLLRTASEGPERFETLHSHLLKSNCLVTRQPDWASVMIRYRGPPVDRAALLRYLVSFRQHCEFHEPCVERIFVDLMRRCSPRHLTVHAHYTRRGGLDINPFRSNFESAPASFRLPRQ